MPPLPARRSFPRPRTRTSRNLPHAPVRSFLPSVSGWGSAKRASDKRSPDLQWRSVWQTEYIMLFWPLQRKDPPFCPSIVESFNPDFCVLSSSARTTDYNELPTNFVRPEKGKECSRNLSRRGFPSAPLRRPQPQLPLLLRRSRQRRREWESREKRGCPERMAPTRPSIKKPR